MGDCDAEPSYKVTSATNENCDAEPSRPTTTATNAAAIPNRQQSVATPFLREGVGGWVDCS